MDSTLLDIWTIWHFLLGVLIYIIFRKRIAVVFTLVICWELFEQSILAHANYFWGEIPINSVFDIIIALVGYFIIYELDERIEGKNQKHFDMILLGVTGLSIAILIYISLLSGAIS